MVVRWSQEALAVALFRLLGFSWTSPAGLSLTRSSLPVLKRPKASQLNAIASRQCASDFIKNNVYDFFHVLMHQMWIRDGKFLNKF
jgi:hypothetical protein